MAQEDHVSVETAKLLKEKGFDWDCEQVYDLVRPQSCADGKMYDNFPDKNPNATDELVSAPTHQIARRWLIKTHGILLIVDYDYECTDTSYFYKIYRLGEHGKPERVAIIGVGYDKDGTEHESIVGYRDYERSHKDYHTYEEACEDAIKYCLENLI